ncbi:MAG: UDP-N-acetylglucosamine 1-carboxyvinyltransferase [Rickettsiaceae bacterium]|jgi:UDP-N-acetylglucosamine 1-carboxyvinyltransferase|nr:UDP-N-acetylglucosamine 1-carboxyvinyltransferase [Rickettsiaceae bacterium]
MDKILIKGGKKLLGDISVSGAKNAALPLLTASLLTEEELVFKNVPVLTDIATMLDLLSHLGVGIKIAGEDYRQSKISPLKLNKTVHANAGHITNFEAPYDIVRKMRASIWVLGPLLARFGQGKVSLPGGCAIGVRQIDLHLDVLKSMGASIELEEGYINATVNGRLTGANFSFSKVSVGATITAIMAATLAEGTSHFTNCAREPEIVDLCNCLSKMGAQIRGIGSSIIEVTGVKALKGTEHEVMADRIEAGTYMIAAAITGGELKLHNINYETVESLSLALQKAGVNCQHERNMVYVKSDGNIKSVDISTEPFPGFATDLQAQFMALMTIADGTSIISENIFENRFMHVLELNRLGANIVTHGNNAIVRGVKALKGAPVMATDLRASVALVLAGLVAEGETVVNRVYHLDRGYEDLEKKLQACGADIERLKGE